MTKPDHQTTETEVVAMWDHPTAPSECETSSPQIKINQNNAGLQKPLSQIGIQPAATVVMKSPAGELKIEANARVEAMDSEDQIEVHNVSDFAAVKSIMNPTDQQTTKTEVVSMWDRPTAPTECETSPPQIKINRNSAGLQKPVSRIGIQPAATVVMKSPAGELQIEANARVETIDLNPSEDQIEVHNVSDFAAVSSIMIDAPTTESAGVSMLDRFPVTTEMNETASASPQITMDQNFVALQNPATGVKGAEKDCQMSPVRNNLRPSRKGGRNGSKVGASKPKKKPRKNELEEAVHSIISQKLDSGMDLQNALEEHCDSSPEYEKKDRLSLLESKPKGEQDLENTLDGGLKSIWEYIKKTQDAKQVVCQLCERKFAVKRGKNIDNCFAHMKASHPDVFDMLIPGKVLIF